LMAAGVAVFTPAAPANGKLKKAERERLELVLEPTRDVLSGLAAQRHDGQTLVGFAAEHGPDAVALGRGKLAAKRLDAVVVNDISRADIGFDVDANEVTILIAPGRADAGGVAGDGPAPPERHVPRASKSQVAEAILDAVVSVRNGR
jgi:phosphopantothenoylcysteine decarboxylase/phosphopantothenate--cysteine ligase